MNEITDVAEQVVELLNTQKAKNSADYRLAISHVMMIIAHQPSVKNALKEHYQYQEAKHAVHEGFGLPR